MSGLGKGDMPSYDSSVVYLFDAPICNQVFGSDYSLAEFEKLIQKQPFVVNKERLANFREYNGRFASETPYNLGMSVRSADFLKPSSFVAFFDREVTDDDANWFWILAAGETVREINGKANMSSLTGKRIDTEKLVKFAQTFVPPKNDPME